MYRVKNLDSTLFAIFAACSRLFGAPTLSCQIIKKAKGDLLQNMWLVLGSF